MVGEREGPGQAVVERDVGFGPVAHADGGIGVGQHLLVAGHEPLAGSVPPLQVARVPALRGHLRVLDRGGQVVRGHGFAVGTRVGHGRPAVRSEREALAAAAQHAEVVVVGVVLHHQHDDVLDLRQQIGADGPGRNWGLTRFSGSRAACQVPRLVPLEPFPHHRATSRSDAAHRLTCCPGGTRVCRR